MTHHTSFLSIYSYIECFGASTRQVSPLGIAYIKAVAPSPLIILSFEVNKTKTGHITEKLT